jgi:S-adenosylmethionine-diacylglycerol 3-amino-3-carboxypropyl transferase
MAKQLTDKVSFDFIRYANCWEDADILLEGLDQKPGGKLLSIGSAGDNSFSLLVSDPEAVVAIDVNRTQLFLVELKKLCITKMEREEFLSFMGFTHSAHRIATFNSIKNELSPGAREYFEKRIQFIEGGLVNRGKFEKYFQYFSGKVLPFIHGKKRKTELFRKKSEIEQGEFYEKKWNNWRWRMLFKFFFSKYMMGKYGRDPEFLKEVTVTVSDYIFKKAGRHLRSPAAQENFMLRFQLTGSFGGLLPHYLQAANYPAIKNNISRLHIREGYAEVGIKEFGKFNGMNLSNIFEYMNKELFSSTASSLLEGTVDGGRLGYWNLMVPRRISGTFPEKAKYQKELSIGLSDKDKGFFYNQFIIDQKL